MVSTRCHACDRLLVRRGTDGTVDVSGVDAAGRCAGCGEAVAGRGMGSAVAVAGRDPVPGNCGEQEPSSR